MPGLISPPRIADRIVTSVPTPASTNNSIIPESFKREYIVLNKHKITYNKQQTTFVFPVYIISGRIVGMFFLIFDGIFVDCDSAHSAHLSSINKVSVYEIP